MVCVVLDLSRVMRKRVSYTCEIKGARRSDRDQTILDNVASEQFVNGLGLFKALKSFIAISVAFTNDTKLESS